MHSLSHLRLTWTRWWENQVGQDTNQAHQDVEEEDKHGHGYIVPHLCLALYNKNKVSLGLTQI